MIPLADDNPTRTTPYVVYGLIALNVLLFLYEMAGGMRYLSMVPWSVVNDMRVEPIVRNGMLLVNQFGQPVSQKLPEIGPHPQWITIFTSMFMHSGWMHIGGNMLYLWIFGNNIEDVLGHAKFLVFYIVCGVLAAFAHIWASMHGTGAMTPTVGASGAIAGVLGAYIILYPRARIRTLVTLWFFWDYVPIPAVYVLGVWFLLQLFGTGGQMTGGGVAYWAHVGGFIAGMILIFIFGGWSASRRRRSYLGPYDEDRPYPWRLK